MPTFPHDLCQFGVDSTPRPTQSCSPGIDHGGMCVEISGVIPGYPASPGTFGWAYAACPELPLIFAANERVYVCTSNARSDLPGFVRPYG